MSATGSQAYIAMLKQDPADPRTIPTNPQMQKVNFVSEDMGREVATKKSDHIRDDRMTTGVTVQGFTVGGGYEYEFQFENSKDDELLAGFLWAEQWVSIGTDVDLTDGIITNGGVLDLSGVAAPPSIENGQFISITGSATSDGRYQCFVSSSNVYSIEPSPTTDETFVSGALGNGAMIRNGKFYQPFYVERGHTDINEFFKFVGMACNTMTLNLPDQADVTGNYKFSGLNVTVDKTQEPGAVYDPPAETNVFSTSVNLKSIAVDGVIREDCFIKDMTIEINNNVTPKTGLGVFGACASIPHSLNINGSLTMYFENTLMFDRLIDGTPFSVSVLLVDSDGHGYAITLPRLQLDTDAINVTGVDDDVMDSASYIATADPITGCMIQIDKF